MVHSSADSKQTNEHRTDRSRVDTQKTTVFCALVFFYKKAMFRIEGHILFPVRVGKEFVFALKFLS